MTPVPTDRTGEQRTLEGSRNRPSHAVEIIGIVGLFFLFGSGTAPAINEPHYLSRAKHVWDPTFCQGDFFLETRDAHTVFFGAFGWITRWASLPATAWIGRLIGWTALAAAWYRLSRTLVPRRGASLLSAAIWITLVQRFHISGEWIIGGIEGKVIAYALVLWGLSYWVQSAWNRTWILQGVAAAFHVLVGGWAVVTTLLAALIERPLDRPRFWQSLPGLMIGGLISLAGLVPAIRLSDGVPQDVIHRAEEIYVLDRIAHHLLISNFASLLVLRHVVLVGVFIALWQSLRRDRQFSRLANVVWGAVALVIVGSTLEFVLGDSTWTARLLRYYWFRASDVFVPMGVSLAVVLTLQQISVKHVGRAGFGLAVITLLVTGNLLATVNHLHFQTIPAADLQGGIQTTAELADWQDTCVWIKEHLPADAILLTPTDHQTFKWYAQRGELVTWKDVPQDAASIVQWSERLSRVRRWQTSETLAESSERLESLERDYPFSHIVVGWPTTFPMPMRPIVFQNSRYVILRAH